jgi:predicted ATPase
MLLKRDPNNPAPTEEALRTAIAVAKQQGTRSFELRAALALAKLYQSTGRPVDAHAVLAPALEGFAPTAEMPEIGEAQALLAALAESNEVRAVEAQRQRRLHLQTAYGQAMMWSKGYDDPEAETTFADALKLAAATADAKERCTAYLGVFAGSLLRGDLALARETAEIWRREAEDEAQAPNLARACAYLGLILLTQGDLAGARTRLEEALAIYDPGWDRDATLRFGSDVGVLVNAYLAIAVLLQGNVAGAREYTEQALARAIRSEHAPSRALAYLYGAILETLRGDAKAALPIAETLVELGQEYGLAQYLAFGRMSRGWARARLGDHGAGLREFRDSMVDLSDRGTKYTMTLNQARLAEIEAELGESALGRIDDALALARDTGEHWIDSLLHRVRGEILLKADPANEAPAEEAFRTAIAVAQSQKARSFELRAALSLAKHYQSTGRLVEAHAILAPALEGFAPTPEMPEIAEAQGLLAEVAR